MILQYIKNKRKELGLTAVDSFLALSVFSVQNFTACSNTCLSGVGDDAGLPSD